MFLQSDTSRYMSQHLRVHVHSTTRTPTVPFKTFDYARVPQTYVSYWSNVYQTFFPGYFQGISCFFQSLGSGITPSSSNPALVKSSRRWIARIACGPCLWYHLVMTNIAMENPNHTWRFRSLGKSSISMGHRNPMAMLNHHLWYIQLKFREFGH